MVVLDIPHCLANLSEQPEFIVHQPLDLSEVSEI